MNNFNLSIVNASEIRFLTGDTREHENAAEMLAEHGLITEKGNPSVSGMAELNGYHTPKLLSRLSSRLKFSENGFEHMRNTYLKMYSEKDYTGMFLFTVLMYGFAGWRVPLDLNLISSRRELLKSFFGEFAGTLEEFEPERSEAYETDKSV